MRKFIVHVVTSTIAIASSSALAATAPPTFCDSQVAGQSPTPSSKEELAGFLLDSFRVSRKAEDFVVNQARQSALGPNATAVIYGVIYCQSTKKSGPNEGDANVVAKCPKADVELLSDVLSESESILKEGSLVFSRQPKDPQDFFSDSSLTFSCKGGLKPETAIGSGEDGGSRGGALRGKTQNSSFSLDNIRVRDTGANLTFDRKDPDFANAGKATISFSNDEVATKKSLKIIGSVGYLIDLTSARSDYDGPVFHAIPYSAFDVDTSKTNDKAKSITNDTIEFGVLFSADAGFSGGPGTQSGGEEMVFIPKFVLNNADHSRIVGVDILYRPYLFNGLNSLIELNFIPVRWNIIINARIDSGHFTALGDRVSPNAKDFARVGGEIGTVFSSDPKFAVPFDLTVSDIYMYALAGDPDALSLFATDLTIYFGEKKTFGLDLAYSRGRAEDLDISVHKWSVGLSVKY